MRKISILAVSVIISLMVGTTAIMAVTTPKKSPTKVVETKAMNAEQMAEHFAKAREALLKKDYKTSAAEIRKVEASLNAEAAEANADSKKELTSAAVELRELANKVDKGSIKTDKELDEDFARAHFAMAKYFHQKATEHYAKNESAKAGEELKLSTAHFQKAVTIMGRETEAAVIKDANVVADKLVAGTQTAEAEVKTTFDNLGKRIEAIGKELKK